MKKSLEFSPAELAVIESALSFVVFFHRRDAEASCNAGKTADFHRKKVAVYSAVLEKIVPL